MNYLVLFRLVPDTVEEIEIAADGLGLEAGGLRLKLCDADEHALEQALLLKERTGGRVTVIALDSPETDDALYTALAKGAERAIKLPANLSQLASYAAAMRFCSFLRTQRLVTPDTLVLLRGQAFDDLEGELGAFIAANLQLPYACVVTAVLPGPATVTVTREFAGGLRGTGTLPLPAVLGIQSAEKPPRYVPFARITAARKSMRIETGEVPDPDPPVRARIERLYRPAPTGHAQMISGSPDEMVDRLIEIFERNHIVTGA